MCPAVLGRWLGAACGKCDLDANVMLDFGACNTDQLLLPVFGSVHDKFSWSLQLLIGIFIIAVLSSVELRGTLKIIVSAFSFYTERLGHMELGDFQFWATLGRRIDFLLKTFKCPNFSVLFTESLTLIRLWVRSQFLKKLSLHF